MYVTGSIEYVHALAADRRRRFERTSPPRRVEGRRRLDLPVRLPGRRGAPGVGTRAA